jgi:hypothetical protein
MNHENKKTNSYNWKGLLDYIKDENKSPHDWSNEKKELMVNR